MIEKMILYHRCYIKIMISPMWYEVIKERISKGDTTMKRTICFDEPNYDPLHYEVDENSKEFQQIKQKMINIIDSLIKEGECDFLSGVRRGIEMLAAEIILDKMEVYPNISLTCICPYEEQPTYWNEDHRERYFTIHQLCSKLVMLEKHYEIDCYQKLDQYLMDHCDTVITIDENEESELLKKAKELTKDIISVNIQK